LKRNLRVSFPEKLNTFCIYADLYSGVNLLGDGLRNFVKEFSLRICWVTEEEDLKLSAMLIVGLLQKKLISKPFVRMFFCRKIIYEKFQD